MKLRVFFTVFLSIFVLGTLSAQSDPSVWNTKLVDNGQPIKILRFSVKINQDGWHIYDVNIPEGGPNSTTIVVDKLVGAKLKGKLYSTTKPESVYDSDFEMTVREFSHSAVFEQKIEITDPKKFNFEGGVKYEICKVGLGCMQGEKSFTFTSKDLSPQTLKMAATTPPAQDEKTETAPAKADTSAPSDTPATADTAPTAAPTPASVVADSASAGSVAMNGEDFLSNKGIWAPVQKELSAYANGEGTEANSSILWIFIYGFIGGLLAILMPCIWPMIPMTVSFFLKRTKDKSKGVRDAITYGLSIIVIYLICGLVVTSFFGASKLNDLSTNAFFNIIFFLLLVVFAISFFGAFEITLPSKWTNKMDSKADTTTGLLSIFFMAFTLVLVSFSCTGPIIGLLLVEAATKGSILGPAVGMFGFALALALPFSLFAVFPGWLSNMPKSGGWLNSVKVVLAFVELALSLKFLSVADLAYGWHILDRETFLVLWIVIFALLGFYLLGKIRFSHDSKTEHVGVFRLFLAIISLAFSVYMIPGLWGAPLKAISAFAPPLNTQDFNLYDGEVHAKFDDYEAGMAYAKKARKPVMVDFSGFGCVNCRNMENSVWINPEVRKLLTDDYVLISLMVDDKRPLPETITVQENGSTVKLRTIGDKWSYLERNKFGFNAQPFYVLLDANGKPLAPSRAYDKDVNAYIKFLKNGLKEYNKRTNK